MRRLGRSLLRPYHHRPAAIDGKNARAADARLTEETRFFNERLAGGKWRGLLSLEPADTQWSSMQIARESNGVRLGLPCMTPCALLLLPPEALRTPIP